MAAISTAILAGTAIASAGVAGYGLYQQNEGKNQQVAAAGEQARIAGLQAQLSAQYAGFEAQLTGEASQRSYEAAAASSRINQSIIGSELNIEGLKRRSMETDARRRQLEIIRNQQRARALGLATTTKAGSSRGSGLQGGYGQISGQTGVNILGVQQALEVGRGIFDENANISNQRIAMSQLQSAYAYQQADITTRQAQMKAQYAQEGAGLTTQYAAAGGQMATGQGQFAYGGSLVQAGQSIFQVGQVGARIGQSTFGGPQTTSMPSYYEPGGYGYVK